MASMEADEYARMDEAESRLWWYRALHARLLDALAPVRGRVLDAGCGTGGLLNVIHARRPDLELAGLEWDLTAARRAAAKSGVPVARGSVNATPFAEATFDAVIAADVLCHAAVDPVRALAELRRILRPGGRLIVNMPAYAWLMSAHDRRVHNARRMSAPEIARMLTAAGFAPAKVTYWNALLLPLMIARRKIAARRHNSASDVAVPSPWLDAMLYAVTGVERALPFDPPAGGSVLAVATRV